jgi:hypothetical protein
MSHALLPARVSHKSQQQRACCLQESDLDAECARKQADSEVQRAKAAARAAAAAKMVREQKLQPHQQVRSLPGSAARLGAIHMISGYKNHNRTTGSVLNVVSASVPP